MGTQAEGSENSTFCTFPTSCSGSRSYHASNSDGPSFHSPITSVTIGRGKVTQTYHWSVVVKTKIILHHPCLPNSHGFSGPVNPAPPRTPAPGRDRAHRMPVDVICDMEGSGWDGQRPRDSFLAHSALPDHQKETIWKSAKIRFASLRQDEHGNRYQTRLRHDPTSTMGQFDTHRGSPWPTPRPSPGSSCRPASQNGFLHLGFRTGTGRTHCQQREHQFHGPGIAGKPMSCNQLDLPETQSNISSSGVLLGRAGCQLVIGQRFV